MDVILHQKFYLPNNATLAIAGDFDLVQEILLEPRWDTIEFEIAKMKVINNLKSYYSRRPCIHQIGTAQIQCPQPGDPGRTPGNFAGNK